MLIEDPASTFGPPIAIRLSEAVAAAGPMLQQFEQSLGASPPPRPTHMPQGGALSCLIPLGFFSQSLPIVWGSTAIECCGLFVG
eukprot:SAG11_NODE_1448_length_4887_cov_2.165831_5_plen_84_part_00